MDLAVGSVSAIFTAIAILYGLWYNDISSHANAKLPAHEQDRAPVKEKIRHVRNQKGIPLIVVNFVMGLIFLPDVIRIISMTALGIFEKEGYSYSSTSAALVLIIALSGVLDIVLLSDILKMSKKISR